MRVFRVALFALFVAAPGLALAESAHPESPAHEVAEHESGHDRHGELTFRSLITSRDFQGTLVNFGALILLFAWVIRKKGNPALAERRKQVEAELEEAQRLRAEAEKRHMETATRLERLDQEMLEIRAEMIKAGEKANRRLFVVKQNRYNPPVEHLKSLIDTGRLGRIYSVHLIEQQIKQLRKDLTKEAANAAVLAAQDLLQASTTDSDQDRLAEAYLERLDEVIEERRS